LLKHKKTVFRTNAVIFSLSRIFRLNSRVSPSEWNSEACKGEANRANGNGSGLYARATLGNC